MNWNLFWVIGATGMNGLLAGMSVDTSLVKLPSRRRIGNVSYAVFARGNDLGNGRIVYPLLGLGSALLTFVATIVVYASHLSINQLAPLYIASATSIIHSFATTKAAPVMLGLKKTPDDERILRAKLDKFEKWQTVRCIFQVITFVVMLWATLIIR